MRAVPLKTRPGFALMRQGDIQSIHYMQMPRWLFSDPRYAQMSLEAKVTYTFLLNRFQLSRRKGWVNEAGEVFVIFPRRALAQELRICEKRIIAAFRQLSALELIWEKRCGRGDANQIYLARVEPQDDPDYECVPFCSPSYEGDGSRTADPAVLTESTPCETDAKPIENCQRDSSRTADLTAQELPIRQPSKKEKRKTEISDDFICLSVPDIPRKDEQTDEEKLADILDACELSSFSPETARVFENAVERLYYSDSFKVGTATLPRSCLRARLRMLDASILRDAEQKLRQVSHTVRNSTAYIMAIILNAIGESESDLLVDPYLNSLRVPLPPRRC